MVKLWFLLIIKYSLIKNIEHGDHTEKHKHEKHPQIEHPEVKDHLPHGHNNQVWLFLLNLNKTNLSVFF